MELKEALTRIQELEFENARLKAASNSRIYYQIENICELITNNPLTIKQIAELMEVDGRQVSQWIYSARHRHKINICTDANGAKFIPA